MNRSFSALANSETKMATGVKSQLIILSTISNLFYQFVYRHTVVLDKWMKWVNGKILD